YETTWMSSLSAHGQVHSALLTQVPNSLNEATKP
ncbi:MAG: hypothetical protein ACI9S6_002696, partial [Reinekea sp.]